MENEGRICWEELREIDDGHSELFFMIAEQTPAGWAFSERSSWEVRWYSVLSTPDLLSKVAELGDGAGRAVAALAAA
jgi:hypothetical protein